MEKKANLETKILEIAARIRELREIEGLTAQQMARETGVSPEEYLSCESGLSDLNFAFLYRCALALNVDITDIIEGRSPTLTTYAITRNGAGQRIEQAHGMVYYNLAHAFRHRTTEPLRVTAIFDPEAEGREIEVTTHVGQECDIVLKGTLKIRIGDHTETLHEGDTIYFDSATPHGMIAAGGQDCVFYAIVINPPEGFVSNTAAAAPPKAELIAARPGASAPESSRVWERFIEPVEDENGQLLSISFRNEETFNFGYDVVDAIAAKSPDKLAMLHIDREKHERRFTFGEMSRLSSRAANYYRSLGIKKGDRVLLVLRRHWQFWVSMLALNKLGAVALLATDQLLQKDFEYRFTTAGITAIVCTAFGGAAAEAEQAMERCPFVTVRVIAGGDRAGWRSFDSEYELFRGTFARTEDTACGSDQLLAFFTSGTTGYPKIALHNHKYPLGHFVTAHYWQCVNPEGLHLTISDTGWAKSMWGKLYGQWLCEAAVFVYDFDKFDSADILPMFRQYGITTFCAPATMYRFMIREDLSKYDLSAIEHACMAGEALNPEVFNQFKKSTGLSIMEGFGQSEGTVLIGNFRGMSSKVGSLGKPTPHYPIDLIDAEGKPVGVGETGEIVIRTEPGKICGLAIEYFNDKKATESAWAGGVYHTGDTAWRDEEGYIWYVGRVDDLIKSSGYRIGPFEIESVIMELPYVLECGVSPVPDEIRGQVVKASVVLTRGTEPSEALAQEIQEYVKKHTAPYKYPRVVVFRDELPKTISGKIQRNKL